MSNEKLDELLPATTAGDLPSSATYYMLEETLKSTDIDEVKAQLVHAWCHFQALELMVAAEASNVKNLRDGVEELHLEDVDPFELAARVYANAAILAAYDVAHDVGRAHVITGAPIDQLMREVFDELDFVSTREKDALNNADPKDFLS